MTELLTASQMRALEQAAIASGEVTGLELMERAGQGVVEAIFEEWPAFAPAAGVDWGPAPKPPGYLKQEEKGPWRAVVLCGPGNNGGDGFVVARLLAGFGWAVDVFFYGDVERLPADARVNYERWSEVGSVHLWNDDAIEGRLDGFVSGDRSSFEHQLVVDALFGVGLTRNMPVDTERARHGFVPTVTHTPQSERPKYVAIDLPSGLCSDSGVNRGAFPTDLTVTFHRPKLGHYLFGDNHFGGGPSLCNQVSVIDIGLESSRADQPVLLMDSKNLAAKLSKNSCEHKFNHGSALVLSGGSGRTGAARLAARGALRIGAGLVTLGVPPAAQLEVAGHVTALMVKRVADADGLAEVLQDKRLNALCLGPGLGLERARALVPVALAAGRASVLDADALSTFADDPRTLFDMAHKRCVLTPHGGEFARLFPDLAEKLNAPAEKGPAYSKVDATREAAARAGCVVLFKGPDTVIADPSGRCSVHAAAYDRAAPWLATAGAGDVLAGFITGLLARGFAPMQAAETATWLHVECARSFGPGLIAEDLSEQLPHVFRELEV
ncbi:Bifunctional NAD(P)H-hydrate repair enzyme Nnr [Ascidiaceihabitans donghaensis]|uniref:Bifunctional NAD(P)H-hydrate repair enzyme n=1 Tax=Ascidiaceihabitans donghaensis TaxID=1510460 RepID=A0A2R8BCN8_9RHOB|nr:NAD(P)H-hydrate dehydratase [Ascidiaceihabitans donghaensis]SPH20844.1 Bifunctional NAD(P)H-hydrate repair enzyme Nnr [Ascidiaceihabitans donghaensis]